MEDLFRVGCYASTHGVHGEFKVFPTTDEPARFKKIKDIILDNGKEQRPAKIQSAKFFKNMVILKLEGIDTCDDAMKLKGYELYVTRKDATPLKKGEYYIADLIGLSVETEDGETLGALSDVLRTGANDVYQVTTAEGKDILIPAIKECILKVDIEASKMQVHLLPGLLDL